MPKKFQTVREKLCFVEKYYSEGKVEKADKLYQLPSQFKRNLLSGNFSRKDFDRLQALLVEILGLYPDTLLYYK